MAFHSLKHRIDKKGETFWKKVSLRQIDFNQHDILIEMCHTWPSISTIPGGKPITFYLPKPRILGRLVRLSFGVTLAWFLFLTSPSEVRNPDGLFWILSIYAFSALSGFFDVLLGINGGRKSQITFLLIALVAAAIDLSSGESVWLPVLGWLIYALIFIMVGLSALSYFLAAVLRTPGCEWRAIPHLFAALRGKDTEYVPCSIYLQKLDQWEENRALH